MAVGAVIVAAGESSRMGGVDKMLMRVGGGAVLAHSLSRFAAHEAIDSLVVVAGEANYEGIAAIARVEAPGARVVLGGSRRRDSVRSGIDSLGECDIVVVHDGARPLVTRDLIDAAIEGALQIGAALCAVPVTDTVKRSDSEGLVQSTVSREGLWLAQTPQAFRRELLLRAHAANDIDATDDAALVELIEEPVRLVQGSHKNVKVTRPEDLRLVEALIASRGYTAS